MTGSLNPDSYDLADTLRMRLAETPARTSSHVETELQQLAARRLDNASAVVRKRPSGVNGGDRDGRSPSA